MRILALALVALGLAHPAIAAGANEQQRILSDAELRRIITGSDAARVELERARRLAERIDLNLARIRARVGTLPLAAEQELRHAEQDLDTLKTREPGHPEIPYLERELRRVRRQVR